MLVIECILWINTRFLYYQKLQKVWVTQSTLSCNTITACMLFIVWVWCRHSYWLCISVYRLLVNVTLYYVWPSYGWLRVAIAATCCSYRNSSPITFQCVQHNTAKITDYRLSYYCEWFKLAKIVLHSLAWRWVTSEFGSYNRTHASLQ
jgi:hypothetical protein